MQDSVSHLRQLRQFIHQTNLCADFFEDCKELERRLHGIKSYLFYRYPQRIVIIDYLQAFDDNDFAENLAIHLVNRVANKTLDVATEEKKLTQQLKELHKFLATLQAVHCELTEYLWAQQVQTIFVKKPNVIQANHLKELKIMSDKHTPESLRSLWLNVMDRFTFSQEARFIRSTYLIHSLVLKLLTRSMGIYLLQ